MAKKVFNAIFKIVEEVSAIVLAVVTVVAFYQIISRYIFQSSNAGIDELTRLAFVWCASLGSALAFRAGSHLGVTALVNKIKGKGREAAEIGINLILIALMVTVAYAGITMTKMGTMQYSEYLRISMAYFYACIPVGAIFSVLAFVEHILESISKMKNWESKEVA